METIVERIRRVCKEQHVPVGKVEKDLAFGNGFLNPKKIKTVPADRLFQIADYLGVSAEYLALGQEREPEYSDLIRAYRKATQEDRAIMDNIIARYVDAKVTPPAKIVPLFGTSAAAGPGEPDTEMPWENYNVPEDSRAEFAVRITGDSMEPELEDGQIALCVKRRPEIGDLAVIMVNGTLLVKQYIRDNYGNVYLRSLNRARQDCDYDIRATGNDTVLCYGSVIVGHRVPLVN